MSLQLVMKEEELKLDPVIPPWRKRSLVLSSGGGGERTRALIRTPVVMDLTLEEGEGKV
jgi:hypothetical protein